MDHGRFQFSDDLTNPMKDFMIQNRILDNNSTFKNSSKISIASN